MDVGEKLNLSSNWIDRKGDKGTSPWNNGFDMVIGSSGKPNEVDDGEAFVSCYATMKGNYIVTMDGWKWWILETSYNTDQMKLATLHEIFHTYWAGHVGTTNRIMTEWVTSGNWRLAESTEDMVTSHDDLYDGPP